MSYAMLCKLDRIDWWRHNLLSLAGVCQPKKKVEESKLPGGEHPPPRGKDVNDFLCHRLGIPIRGSHSKEPER